MKKKRLVFFSIMFITTLLLSFAKYSVVFAAHGNGTSGPGGTGSPSGSSGCEHDLNTCTGAAWMYYAWPGDDAEVTIEGAGENSALYKTVTISGRNAEICHSVGGYYRYGLVRKSNGQQWGVASISGYTTNWANSTKFGGGMHYRGPDEGGEDWDTVKAAYEKAKAAYPDDFAGTDGFESGSNLGWFCASYGNDYVCAPEDCPDDPGQPPEYYCPGIAAPHSYNASDSNEGWSAVITKARKSSALGDWTDTVWAKPGDGVTWRHCYFPGMQKVANTLATSSHPHEPTKLANILSTSVFDNVVNQKMSSFGKWNNSYNIKNRAETAAGSSGTDLPYNYGEYEVRYLDNNYDVKQDWVGNGSYEQSTLVGDVYHAAVNETASDTWNCTYKAKCRETVAAYCKKTGNKVCSTGAPVTNGMCQYGELIEEESCEACVAGSHDKPCNGNMEVDGECEKPKECSHSTNLLKPTKDKALNGGLSTDSATVNVPFNFNMSGTISLAGNYVYAGEAAQLKSGSVTVENRKNDTTGGTYATRVEGVKAQILTFVWGSPVTSVPADATVRYGKAFEIGNMSANETKTLSSLGTETVNVDDETAGTYFCVAIQVSPTSSGSDTTMNASGFDKSYKRSGADCKPIAKRPSFQVWGGSLFSNGEIRTGRAIKNNLKGVTDRKYKVIGVNDANVFGSWVEHSVMSIGKNGGQTYLGLASASATAFSGAINKNTNYEKSPKSGLCTNESNLSFANAAAGGISICGIDQKTNGFFTTNRAKVDKKSIVTDIWPTVEKDKNVSSLTIGSDGSYKQQMTVNGKLVRYTYASNKLTINTSNDITVGKTGGNNKETATSYIIWADKDVYINGNITYKNDTYTNLDKMPKVVIYSAGNIYVGCHVERIDAVLIAEKNFDSCTDANGKNPGINTTARRNQLRINGSLIADRIRLTRTYGAGPGQQSGDPAEIINYDTSLIIWSRAQADTSASNKLNVTYTNEIAPRY